MRFLMDEGRIERGARLCVYQGFGDIPTGWDEEAYLRVRVFEEMTAQLRHQHQFYHMKPRVKIEIETALRYSNFLQISSS